MKIQSISTQNSHQQQFGISIKPLKPILRKNGWSEHSIEALGNELSPLLKKAKFTVSENGAIGIAALPKKNGFDSLMLTSDNKILRPNIENIFVNAIKSLHRITQEAVR